jgi:protein SCO1/2
VLKTTTARVAVAYRAHGPRAMPIAMLLLYLTGAASQAMPPSGESTLNRLPSNWRDDQGETLRLQALRGTLIFVTMAYTSCHRICPMTMARLQEVQHDLDARGMSAEFLIVSYDPRNDDSGAWRRYRTRHGLLRGNWHFLNGNLRDTEQLARVLGFEFWRDGDHVMHDYRIVALGHDGVQRGVIDAAHSDWLGLL